MAIRSRYNSRCAICDLSVSVGEFIVPQNGSWAHEQCAKKETEALEIIVRLQKVMVAEHRIGYGYFVQEGCRRTSTPRKFLNACIEHGEITDKETNAYRWFYRGMIDHDLAD